MHIVRICAMHVDGTSQKRQTPNSKQAQRLSRQVSKPMNAIIKPAWNKANSGQQLHIPASRKIAKKPPTFLPTS
jgi:hypothetical protein